VPHFGGDFMTFPCPIDERKSDNRDHQTNDFSFGPGFPEEQVKAPHNREEEGDS
jgi:hypothetical protein